MPFNFSEEENKILKFWKDNKIFEKTLEKTKKSKNFVFYDGPPFATGLPHYGHILSSVAKDVFPRYKTMQDFFVDRRWGWDCHGLPIENIVEKEKGISGKKDIEKKIGVEKFNDSCRAKVLTYTKEWKKMVDRVGRFVDFDDSYKTMDSTYMESVWWALKTLWDKGLIYEGKKILMYCPRCETPVSKAEVAMDNSYKNITEEAVTVKFEIKNPKEKGLPENTYFLAWTTTPWTLPANVALAVGEKIKYILIEAEGSNYILAKELVDKIFAEKKCKTIKDILGKDLVGLKYNPLYELEAIKKTGKKAWQVLSADFVNTEEGTGIVHTAVIYGEDDYKLGIENDLAMVPLLDSKGVFNDDAPDFIKGKYLKDAEKDIKNDLKNRELLFSKNQNTHPYPFCWRCETQLFYNAVSAWFINIQKDKKKFIKFNEKINWVPEHLKHGRFLNILKDAPDWNISRNRYWATPLPFFKCECGNIECVGSVKELKEKALNFSEVYKSDKAEEIDLHKDKMDRIQLKCKKCKGRMKRIPEVIDCWVESASMPFAELHYPFAKKHEFKKRLPAQYISEYIAQTRTWFYYLHVLSVLLFNKNSFENVVSTGTILNEKGEKLSKSKMNYPDPWNIIDRYGADALRFYLMSSSIMQSEDLFFNERDVRESYNKVVNSLCNVAEFYSMYAPKNIEGALVKPINILDKWILSRLNNTNGELTLSMEKYDTIKSCRIIKGFIEDLSLWYVRRSRERFKEDGEDKNQAGIVLKTTLLEFSKLIAPILPFTAEYVFKHVKNKKSEESVHLEKWPKQNTKLIDNELEEKGKEVRKIVSMALAERSLAGVRVRQPLNKLKIKNQKSKIKNDKNLLALIKDEVNVKNIEFNKTIEKEVELDLKITEELKQEGVLREIIRFVQGARKEAGLKPTDNILACFEGAEEIVLILEKNKEALLKEISAEKINFGECSGAEFKEDALIDGKNLSLAIKKANEN
jgi:isoleucyl-tRNA synthetase